LPPDTAVWNRVERIAREVFRAYNYHEIRTPILEEEQLFARGVGADTDIVSKEMYAFEDSRWPAAGSSARKHGLGDSRLHRNSTTSAHVPARARRKAVTGSFFRSARKRSAGIPFIDPEGRKGVGTPGMFCDVDASQICRRETFCPFSRTGSANSL